MASSFPEQGVFRWAWSRAIQYLGILPVAVLAPGVLIILVGALVVPPHHASGIQRLLTGLVAAGVAAAAALVLTYAVALAVAADRYRHAPRHDRARAGGRTAAMQTEPVGSEHAGWLRQVAAQLNKCLDSDKAPLYGASNDEEIRLWRSAFHEHFPDLRSLLEVLENEQDAITVFRNRLIREVAAAGMDQLPWLPDEFIPGIVSMTERRSMTRSMAGELVFDWHESAGSLYSGEPGLGLRVLRATGPYEEVTRYKGMFEGLVRSAQSWPESANIRISWEVHQIAKEAVVRQLEVIALTRRFTSRCQLCKERPR